MYKENIMELTTRTITDGIKIPIAQVKTIFDMVEYVYKTLETSETATDDQKKVYSDLLEIMPKITI